MFLVLIFLSLLFLSLFLFVFLFFPIDVVQACSFIEQGCGWLGGRGCRHGRGLEPSAEVAVGLEEPKLGAPVGARNNLCGVCVFVCFSWSLQ